MTRLRPLALFILLAAGSVGAQGATMTVPGLGQMVAGNGVKQTLACGSDPLTVNGNSNTLTLTGACRQVTVNGNKNVITVGTLGRVTLNGSGNTLSWHRALKGSKPVISAAGRSNTVRKR